MAQIHEAISAIMSEIGPISKDRKNTQQGYNFRGIDDVYAAVHPLLVKHGVFSVPRVTLERSEERTTKSGSALIYRVLTIEYTFFARDGSSVVAVVIGEGMDSGDKASNKAMSVAHKYAILQLLAIPTDEPKDPEDDSHDVVTRAAPPADPILDELSSLAAMLGKTAEWKRGMMRTYNNDYGKILDELRKEARAIEARELDAAPQAK